MATANREALLNMKSKLQAMGAALALIGEPKSVVQDGTVAIIPSSGRIVELTLTSPRENHVVTLRRYANALKDPQENIEFDMDKWRAEIEADICGDFDLGGKVAYALPDLFEWTYGYQTIGAGDKGVMYRLLDLTIAYRIDDNASFAA